MKFPWLKIRTIKFFQHNPNIRENDVQRQMTVTSGTMKDEIKIITDEPSLKDALDFHSYSKKLADIIRNSTPRFAIGVFGGWGTGKITLMKMIEADLNGYVFNWENVLENDNDENEKLIAYLKENFHNCDLDWIEEKKFKRADEQTIGIFTESRFLSISIDKKTARGSILIDGKPQSDDLFFKEENGKMNIYKKQVDILTVWFDAWKYEREKYLALIPFLRQIRIRLENEFGKERK